MQLDLTPQQKKLIAAGLTILATAIIIAAIVTLLVYISRFFQAFSHVFLPLAVAAIAAMVLDPWYAWLRARSPMPIALALVYLSIIIPLATIIVFFGTLIANQLFELIQQLPVWWANFVAWFQEYRPNFDRIYNDSEFGSKISEILKSPGGPLAAVTQYLLSQAASAGSSVASGILSLLGWIIVPVYLTFFLMIPRLRPDSLTTEHFPFLKPDTAKDIIYLIREFFNLVVIFFRGQILIALIQGILFAIGFTLAGLQYGAVLGLILGFLNIIPYLGSMVGLSVCLPIAWFQADGGLVLLMLILVVFCMVQLIEGYYLTPKIMGDATGLSPLAIIVGIFFWGAALDGILGMILAIPLTAFVVVLWRLAKEKYIGQVF